MKNNYLYQGAYSELDDDIGWNDFELRNYDPQIGRWVQQDPYQEYASPYVGMGTDPVNLVDPSGGFVLAGLTKAGTAAILMLGGAIIGEAAALISGDDDFTGALIGAGVGLGAGLGNLSKQIAISLGIHTANTAALIINTSTKTAGAGASFHGSNSSPEPKPEPSEMEGIDPMERLRILAAIGLGEGGNGYTFNLNELVQIAYVYIHKEAKGKPLGHKSSFYAAKGKVYKMYMYILGSPKYAADKDAINESKKIDKSHTQKIKEVLQELICFTDPRTSKEQIPAANNPDITVQGYYKDLNGERGDPDFWNRVRWYVYYVYSGKIPKTNNVYVFLGTDSEHKNATFLIDEKELNKFVNQNKDWIDTKQAPKYDQKTDTFKPDN